MPRDDYFRLVFKVLSELYTALKAGECIDVTKLTAEALRIPQAYWAEIMCNLLDDGYASLVNHLISTYRRSKRLKLKACTSSKPLNFYLS